VSIRVRVTKRNSSGTTVAALLDETGPIPFEGSLLRWRRGQRTLEPARDLTGIRKGNRLHLLLDDGREFTSSTIEFADQDDQDQAAFLVNTKNSRYVVQVLSSQGTPTGKWRLR